MDQRRPFALRTYSGLSEVQTCCPWRRPTLLRAALRQSNQWGWPLLFEASRRRVTGRWCRGHVGCWPSEQGPSHWKPRHTSWIWWVWLPWHFEASLSVFARTQPVLFGRWSRGSSSSTLVRLHWRFRSLDCFLSWTGPPFLVNACRSQHGGGPSTYFGLPKSCAGRLSLT